MAVKVILLVGEKSNAILAAFLQLDNDKRNLLQAGKVIDSSLIVQIVFLTKVDKKIANCLPSYIIPNVYFALLQLPITVSSKTDKKQLREIRASFLA